MHYFSIVAVFSIPPLNMTSSLVFSYRFNAFDQLSGGSIIEVYRMIFLGAEDYPHLAGVTAPELF